MQVLVVGAGVIGLAVARAAALAGHDVTVAEITGGIANGVSSRNSEVIHAGLYYPTDTLRAKLCVDDSAPRRPPPSRDEGGGEYGYPNTDETQDGQQSTVDS